MTLESAFLEKSSVVSNEVEDVPMESDEHEQLLMEGADCISEHINTLGARHTPDGLIGNIIRQRERGTDPRANCSPFSEKYGSKRNGNQLEEVIRKVTQRYKNELMIKLQIS